MSSTHSRSHQWLPALILLFSLLSLEYSLHVFVIVIVFLLIRSCLLIALREADPFQNGWIFGKVPNGLWPPPPHFRKVMLQIFSEIHDRSIVYNGKNLQFCFIQCFPVQLLFLSTYNLRETKTYLDIWGNLLIFEPNVLFEPIYCYLIQFIDIWANLSLFEPTFIIHISNKAFTRSKRLVET